jgi:hypothetical protein
VHGNPVNFNDPTGHVTPGGQGPVDGKFWTGSAHRSSNPFEFSQPFFNHEGAGTIGNDNPHGNFQWVSFSETVLITYPGSETTRTQVQVSWSESDLVDTRTNSVVQGTRIISNVTATPGPDNTNPDISNPAHANLLVMVARTNLERAPSTGQALKMFAIAMSETKWGTLKPSKYNQNPAQNFDNLSGSSGNPPKYDVAGAVSWNVDRCYDILRYAGLKAGGDIWHTFYYYNNGFDVTNYADRTTQIYDEMMETQSVLPTLGGQ